MEQIVKQMLNEEEGVPIKTVKSFLSKIPSVFTGADLVAWVHRTVPVSDMGKVFGNAVMSLYAYNG